MKISPHLQRKLENLGHLGLKVMVVSMIAFTSIAAYHAWWKMKWHRVFSQRLESSAITGKLPSNRLGKLRVQVSERQKQSSVDWLNLVLDGERLAEPIAVGAATVWIERRRKQFNRRITIKRSRVKT